MAMSEYKSPLIYMWQYLNRSVFEFIRSSRKYITLPLPANSGDTITLYLSAPETIVKFTGPIANDFDLDVKPVNAKLGDKLYLIMNGDGGSYTITSTGNLLFNDCGPNNNPLLYDINVTATVIIPFLFDGTNFVGLDYC